MCVNHKLIYTRQHKPMVVKCGHCPACLQEKANRYASLIRSESIGDGDHVTLFVTLTYSNKFIPYVLKSEILESLPLGDPNDVYARNVNVYRHNQIRSVRVGFGKYMPKMKVCDKIGVVHFPSLSESFVKRLTGYHTKHYSSRGIIECVHPDKVGVLFYPDIQNFFKKLRVNYERSYGQKLEMSYFYTGEVGPDTLRPHFHALIRVRREDEVNVRSAIVKSWQFHDWELLQRISDHKLIQVAYDCAKYVAGYVNSSSYLPKVFQGSDCRPKCHHSKFYGFSRNAFSLPSLLEAYNRRDLHYLLSFCVKGCVYEYSFLLPSYVIKRYFPKIKGFNKLPFNIIHDIYKEPYRLLAYARKLGYDSHYDHELFTDFIRKSDLCLGRSLSFVESCYFRHHVKEFSKHNDLMLNLHVLQNARQRFILDYANATGCDDFGVIVEKYAQMASDIWNIFSSNSLKDSYELYPLDEWCLYSYQDGMSENVNTSKSNIYFHDIKLKQYDKYDKSRRLNGKMYRSYSLNY